MKSLILIVVTLFLASITLVIYGEVYKYGDIIAFPRKLPCPCGPLTYKHYALYVGTEKLKEKLQNQDIFHLTGSVRNIFKGKRPSNCIFDELAKESEHKLDNYLDEMWKKEKKEIDLPAITRRIEEKYNNCGSWNPATNNCEHTATYVRYGLKLSLQCGTTAAHFVWNPEISRDMLAKIREIVMVPTCEAFCPKSSSNRDV